MPVVRSRYDCLAVTFAVTPQGPSAATLMWIVTGAFARARVHVAYTVLWTQTSLSGI
jgi:hypothetical protein|eukprot:COSAG01_NODE_732_length_13996_cov_33.626322_6_plen_57_part_00